ncbi:DUF4179 domain-containing protein, partial [Gottfriedia acidiceleris]|uniref:DUF4179 domain-containing protein n=1 Tax=Gottfriedia acidiceleris TaxID=371036 RepID=UPI0033995648
MKKDKSLMHMKNAIEKQVPDVWEKIKINIENEERADLKEIVIPTNNRTLKKSSVFYKRLSIVAAVCLICLITLTFTPVLASIQQMYDKVFSSSHIDDSGVRAAINLGKHQSINHTYFDKANDITVHFEGVMTDDKETKLLLTYKSKTKNLKNYYIDIFEGDSSINLAVGNDAKMKLKNVGWGSRYYVSKENKVVEALSEIENITIYGDKKNGMVPAIWNLNFKLAKSAISERKTVEVNKNLTFKDITYKIKKVEFSTLETRVAVT